ncbi:hypothetical protein [Domibacillus iocasae]|uniref:Citrate transporter-like domain-containing protein n=1 Tax=Domibacillus iocasae TaxID=1714016 RepID=A0A1E7DNX1_9BACI|nr:hypothetical protein [Domibacillus iocasae]OES44754.1 hypothetical protein BA724_05620 [Domibacillus iocasae]
MKIQQFFFCARSSIFTLAVLLFLVFQLMPFKGLDFILSVVSILAIALSLSSCKLFTRLMSIVFLTLGTWMVWNKDFSFVSYIKLYGDMLYLLSLFLIVPLLSIPIQVGEYRKVFEQLFQKRVKSISQFYRIITGLSYFLGSFLNLAAIPIVHSSVKSAVDVQQIDEPKRFLASSIIQGYSLPNMWTPLSGVVGAVLYVTDVSWIYIFPTLFLISLVTLIFNWTLFSIIEHKKSGRVKQETAVTAEHTLPDSHPLFFRKMLQTLLAIILLLLLIVGVDAVFSLGLTVSVTLITLPFAWLWCLTLRKGQAFMPMIKQHFTHKVGEMSESFAIFLSAGFFVQALQYSGNDRFVNQLFVQFSELVGVHFFLFLIPYITLLLAYLGMHPIVVVTLLAQSLAPDILGVPPEQLAIAFLGGAVMTFYMGPFSGTLGLMSSIIDVAPLRISRWSLVQVIGFSFILTAAFWLG